MQLGAQKAMRVVRHAVTLGLIVEPYWEFSSLEEMPAHVADSIEAAAGNRACFGELMRRAYSESA